MPRTAKKVKDKVVRKAKTTEGEEQFIIVTDETVYSFTNLRAGAAFFKRENGEEDMFAPGETKENITEKERNMLLKTLDYKNGWIVEEGDSEPDSGNAYNDLQLITLVEKYKNNHKELEKYIRKMDSDFSIKRIKDILVKKDFPNSMVALCDYQLSKIEEEYLKSKEVPVDIKGIPIIDKE